MNWKIILAAVAILFSGMLYAQTPDGETPSTEEVCNVLRDATPGLFGLCVAFCEAQDCDWRHPDPLSGQCEMQSPQLLENYNKKKANEDPIMPCLYVPPTCPCFTYEDLVRIVNRDEYYECGNRPNEYQPIQQWVVAKTSENPPYALFDFAEVIESSYAHTLKCKGTSQYGEYSEWTIYDFTNEYNMARIQDCLNMLDTVVDVYGLTCITE